MTIKILVINPFGIGDVIFSTPLLGMLRSEYPGSFIGYVCNKRAYEVIKTNPHIDKIFIYEKDEYRDLWRRSPIWCVKKIISFLKEVKDEKFDLSVDLSLGYQNSLLLKAAGIKRRLGFNYRNRGKFLTDKMAIESFDDRHVVEHYTRLLTLLGIDTSKYNVSPKIYASDAGIAFADKFLRDNAVKAGDIIVGLMPGCGESWGSDAVKRRWDRRNFAALADRLADRYGAKTVLLGNAKETDICDEIQASMKNGAVNYCGKTSIDELIGIFTKCKLVVTNEGGPLHIATALGVRTVSLFGPVDEKTYGPYPAGGGNIVISKKDLPCRPCYKKFKYNDCDKRLCLDTISVDEVFRAAEAVIAG